MKKIMQVLIPSEQKFFALVHEHANLCSISIQQFNLLLTEQKNEKKEEIVKKITTIEEKSNAIARSTINELYGAFITPIDKEDMHTIILSLEKIINTVHDCAIRIVLYKMPEPQKYVTVAGQAFSVAFSHITDMIKQLEEQKNLQETCLMIRALEKKVNINFHQAIKQLYSKNNEVEFLLKQKDIYDLLEKIMDQCEKITNALEQMGMKYA